VGIVLSLAGFGVASTADSPQAFAAPTPPTSVSDAPYADDQPPADPDANAERVQPIVPDVPARSQPVVVPAPRLPSTASLDGFYVWLGPVGAASHIDGQWDSTFGAEAAVVVVHEQAPLATVGVTAGASRWTERGGGRVWVDGLVGTHILGHMLGASLGPIVELSDLAHPRVGGSVGVWGFAGITPFVRVGGVQDLGMFAEVGIHIALPAVRR
jgi:hypothetical protein